MSPKESNNATSFSVPVLWQATQSNVQRISRLTLLLSHKRVHTQINYTKSSLLMQNASSPKPQTQFSTLLWSCAVNSPRREENKQHLSWATRWRNVIHTAVAAIGPKASCRKFKMFFTVNFGKYEGKKVLINTQSIWLYILQWIYHVWSDPCRNFSGRGKQCQLLISTKVECNGRFWVFAEHKDRLIMRSEDDVVSLVIVVSDIMLDSLPMITTEQQCHYVAI